MYIKCFNKTIHYYATWSRWNFQSLVTLFTTAGTCIIPNHPCSTILHGTWYTEECGTWYTEECGTWYSGECGTWYSEECGTRYTEECGTW